MPSAQPDTFSFPIGAIPSNGPSAPPQIQRHSQLPSEQHSQSSMTYLDPNADSTEAPPSVADIELKSQPELQEQLERVNGEVLHTSQSLLNSLTAVADIFQWVRGLNESEIYDDHPLNRTELSNHGIGLLPVDRLGITGNVDAEALVAQTGSWIADENVFHNFHFDEEGIAEERQKK